MSPPGTSRDTTHLPTLVGGRIDLVRLAQHIGERDYRDWNGWPMSHDLRSNFHRRFALRSRGRTRRPETGDTLIEVLLAVMVMGISSVAILLAFGTSIFGSSEYRGLATTDTVLRTAAEEVTNLLQAQSGALWTDCGGVTALNTTLASVTVPSGYTLSPLTATYWSSSSDVYLAQNSSELPPNPVACPTGAATNPSALVTITLAAGGKSYNISTVVNDPSAPATPLFGTAAQLVFIGQPGSGTAGNTLSAPPEVAVEDNGTPPEIVTTDLSSVQLTLNSPSGVSGATLSGDCSGAEIGGVITFSNCSVSEADLAGDGGYWLTATDTELPLGSQTATSSKFYVSASTAAQIAFTTNPGDGTGGSQLSTEPQVSVEDAYGDVVTNDNSSLSLSIESGTGTAGAQPTAGCSTPTETSGVFSFTNCGVNLVGSGYVLVATDGSMTADSGSFDITAGPAAGVAFTTQPSASNSSGVVFSNQPKVSIADAGGNAVTSATATPVTLSLASGVSGVTGAGTLTCPWPGSGMTVSTSSITASFSGCKITLSNPTVGGTFELKATATYGGTPYSAYSQSFQVAGTANHLIFSTSPGASTSGVIFSTQPVVEVVDANNNVVTSSTASILLEDGGSHVGTVSCPGGSATVAAVNGIATFSNCEVTLANPLTSNEGSFTLEAYVSSSLNGTTSFTVAGPATQLAFVNVPGNSTTATAFGTQPVVQVEDAAGDLVTNSTTTVTLNVNSGSGTLGCPTAGGASVAAVGGIATFSGCEITLSGSAGGGPFTLKATAVVGLTTLNSLPTPSFNVAGPANKLVFTTQPSNGTGGVNLATQPQVTVEDANGYVVTADSSTVILSLNSPGSSGASVSDTCAGTESLGVVTFSGCSVNQAGSGYTFTATDGSLTSATSSPFNITTGTAAQLVFTTSPLGGIAGQAFGVQPVVAVEDAGGNLITTGAARSIALTITGGAPLACTSNTATTSGGVATFAGCETTSAGANISLSATTSGFPVAISHTFNVSPGAASVLAITSSPVSGLASQQATLGPITVQEEDAYGNPVVAGASNLQVTLASSSSAGVFSDIGGPPTVTSVTIPYGLSSTTFYYGDTKAGLPTITVSAAGLAPASEAQTIVPAPASQLFITSSPVFGAASATANLGPITVQEQDPFGNPSPAGSGGQAVTLAATGTGTFATTLGGSGATSLTIPAGSTSVPFYFGDETLGSQTVTASAFGTQVTQPETIGASPPSATLSTVVANPTTNVTANGTTGLSTVTVTLKDAFGNSVANKAVSLTPGGGSSIVTTVSGTTNASGVATFTVTDTVAQTATYTAKDTTDGITLATTPTVAFVAGPASPLAANSTVVASPTTVSANGTSASTITVTARDATNNPEIGDTVTLSAGSGSSLITTLSGTTNSSGQATFSVSDNAAQPVTYTATDVNDGVTLVQTATVTFTSDPASAANSTAVASPTTGVTANGTAASTITVTIKDGAATPLPISNQVVTLTQGSGSSVITTVSGTTNSSGIATFTVKDTHAQTVTYTATDTTAGVSVTMTPTVAFVAGPASPLVANSTVVASPTSLTTSNTTTSTVTVTALDANNNPENGDTITLTAGGGSSVISPASATANSSGVATFTVKDTVAQAVTYTAHDTTDVVTMNQTPTVTFLTGTASASASTVVASSSSVKANGTSATTITVTDTDTYGNPEVGDTITLTQAGGASVISTSPATTNSNGVATFTVADNTAQLVTYTAKDTTANVTFTETAPVTFTADAANATNSKAVANPTTGVTANGTTSSLITVTIKDGSAIPLPIANQTVTLTPGSGSSLITTVSGTTNASGIATFTVTDTTAQAVTYTAKDTTANVTVAPSTATVTFVAGPTSSLATNSTVGASPISVLANGTSVSTITVTAKDVNNNPEIGDTITLGQGAGTSLITTISGTTNSSGQATFSVADNAAQAVIYTATDVTDTVTLAQTATVTFTADSMSAANSTAVAVPPTGVTANGTATSTITVTIKDTATPTANPIANQTVTLTPLSGASVVTPVSGTTTNGSGQVLFTVTDTTAQSVTYQAKDTTANLTVTATPSVTFVAGPASASNSTVVASSPFVTANGTSTSTITVTALDANGNPDVGKSISLTAGSGSSVITTSPTTANSFGVATFTVKAGTLQNVTYTARDVTDNVTITQTATVGFVGTTSAGASTVVASSPSVLANGTSASTITVTVKDALSNPEIGHTITLTQGGTSSVITTSPATTNSLGVATFTVADNTAQAVTYTAHDTTGTTVTITQTAPVTFTTDSMSAANSKVSSNATSGATSYTITVTILDGQPTPLPIANQTVTLTPSVGGSTITPVSGTTTNSSGQVQFTVSVSSGTPTITYTAKDTTANVTVAPSTATVSFT